ncbi:glycosyltransferase [Cyanobacterium aponinum UTEX 3222]|uniref:glycosyltransferase n=1 Tax=Cyanobacterium aponinum TaxID=379064 RepID=UPI002B4C194B|nr:glycosyltransferase [Cyanobacterium aponinum]WRL38022.1 glycosyltransferase [Cyanobacterium aponinum UTEX 3221]WRL41495.1 glycosyltransferase [Cyanobacterium aponinum UTEX 3222]
MTKVSLIMTVYNRADYLAQAIDSVIVQTYPYWELIIINDGSTDKSLDIANTFATKDSRILVTSSPHLGRALALQKAHALAQGEYLGWLDSDDWLAPKALEATVEILQLNPQVGMVYTNYQVVNEQGQILGDGKRCQIPYSKERLLVDLMIFHFRLFRRQVFELAGGIDPFFPVAMDYDLCLRLSEITQIQHLPLPLYYYRHHRNSISGARRLEQIYYSSEAIKKALHRRGLAEKMKLEVEVSARFRLRRCGGKSK